MDAQLPEEALTGQQVTALCKAIADILQNPQAPDRLKRRLTDLLFDCREALPADRQADLAVQEALLLLPEIIKRLE